MKRLQASLGLFSSLVAHRDLKSLTQPHVSRFFAMYVHALSACVQCLRRELYLAGKLRWCGMQLLNRIACVRCWEIRTVDEVACGVLYLLLTTTPRMLVPGIISEAD